MVRTAVATPPPDPFRCRRCGGRMPQDIARLERWTHHPSCDPREWTDLRVWAARLRREAENERRRPPKGAAA